MTGVICHPDAGCGGTGVRGTGDAANLQAYCDCPAGDDRRTVDETDILAGMRQTAISQKEDALLVPDDGMATATGAKRLSADFSACADRECPSKDRCLRQRVSGSGRQVYNDFGRQWGALECADVIPLYEAAKGAPRG